MSTQHCPTILLNYFNKVTCVFSKITISYFILSPQISYTHSLLPSPSQVTEKIQAISWEFTLPPATTSTTWPTPIHISSSLPCVKMHSVPASVRTQPFHLGTGSISTHPLKTHCCSKPFPFFLIFNFSFSAKSFLLRQIILKTLSCTHIPCRYSPLYLLPFLAQFLEPSILVAPSTSLPPICSPDVSNLQLLVCLFFID